MNSSDSKGLYSIMALEHFVGAIRDSGYKGTASAVSELVDNSIQANARKICITIQKEPCSSELTLSLLDNGCGMDPFTLRQALQFGGSSRFNDREGFGRYGMGLPNSSFSQARHVKVYSWQSAVKRDRNKPSVYLTELDFDDISQGVSKNVPVPKIQRNPPEECKWKSGTLVLWSRCDRLDNRRIPTITRKLILELGKRFRYYISKGIKITVNNEPVIAVDPLFLNPCAAYSGAKQYGKELVYEVSTDYKDPDAKTGIVKVRFSELPVKRWRKLSNLEKRERGISKGAGISILRAGREVDTGWFFTGSKRKENYDDWWRCEVDFDPILDEIFGITHTKQQIRPSEYLNLILTPDIESIARTLNKRVRDAHKEIISSIAPLSKSETIATKKETLLSPIPKSINTSAKKQMQKLCGKRLIKPYQADAFQCRIVPVSDRSTVFFSYGFSKNTFALAINQSHPFFREMNALLNSASSNRCKDIYSTVELLLLSAVRSEVSETNNHNRKIIEKYRGRWSDILATYINR